MKKIITSLALMATLLVGCQKPELVGPGEGKESFTASVEEFDSQTKTAMTASRQVIWMKGDRIAIFQGSTVADEYLLSDQSAGTTSGAFLRAEGSSSTNGGFFAGTEISCNVALYPYAEGLAVAGELTESKATMYKITNFIFPQTQTYAENSFANGAFPMVAVNQNMNDPNLKFKNVAGALKLQFKGTQKVKAIRVKGNNGERLAGACTVAAYDNNSAPSITMADDAYTEVTLDCGEGVQLSETAEKTFIIALPPVKFEKGLTAVVTYTNGMEYTVSTSKENNVLRSGLCVMPALALGQGTPAPEPAAEKWSLIGDFSAWNDDLALESDGTFYFVKNVELEGQVKFRRDADWAVNFGLGGENELIPGVPYPLVSDGQNITFAPGKYDIYLDPTNARAWFITDGSYPEPVAYSWGVVGLVNDWGNSGSGDIAMSATDTEGLFVARNVEMPDGGFKIRANNDWVEHGNYGVPSVGDLAVDHFYSLTWGLMSADMNLAAGTYDIWFDLYNAMVYVMTPGKDISEAVFADTTNPEPEPDPELPSTEGWGLVGAFNSWGDSPDIKLVSDGTYHVATGVSVEGEFKLRRDSDWAVNLGAAAEVAVELTPNAETTLVLDGANLTIASGVYDIYLDEATGKVWFINDGSYPSVGETPEFEPTASIWGVVGVVNNWGGSADIVMYTTETFKLFVARNVVMPDGGFKIRGNNTWSDAENFGLATAGPVEVDHVYELVSGGASGDMTLAAGTYDIWFDLANAKVYVMTPGKDISEAVGGDVVVPDPSAQPWYLVGDFNVWKPADANYQMTKEGSWYVYRNFSANGNGVKFVADASWSVNRGGVFVQAGAAISLNQGGADMYVAAGTYDVYLSADASVAYFMTPGSVPATR